MRKEIMLCLCACVSVITLGCGSQTEDGTIVSVEKNGSVKNTIIEDFSAEYYDVEELKNLVLTEIAEYNKANGGNAISIDSLEQKKDSTDVRVVMNYATAEDYASFNETEFFYGTVAEAKEAGFSVTEPLVDASDTAKTIGADELNDMTDYHMLVASDAVAFTLPNKILYASEGVTVDGKKAAGTDGLFYIVTK
ncbi:MAG: hypothetical protein PHP50_03585 [Lachnospiraceae bacterium]|nr:hypothetical protein [Lachnospiraceae bacterium]